MDSGNGGEKPTPEPDVGFWQGLFDSVKGWFDNLCNSIGDWFIATLGKITDLNNSVNSWFSELWESIKSNFISVLGKITDINNSVNSWFSSVIEWFKNFPSMIGDLFDSLFNPNSGSLSDEFSIFEELSIRLTWVDQIRNAISNMATVGQPLQLPKVKLGQWEIDINGKFFEPYVPKIRASIATLFWVMCFLSCWRTVSSAFGLGVNAATGLSVGSFDKGSGQKAQQTSKNNYRSKK